jgi:Zn-dependent peptidase ImmA (M78 family)
LVIETEANEMARKALPPDQRLMTASFTTYAETLYLLDLYCRQNGVSRGAVVRQLVNDMLAKTKQELAS